MVDIDGVHLRNVSIPAMLGGGIFAAFLAYAALSTISGSASWQPIVGGLGLLGFAAFVLIWAAYQSARPEFDGYCEHCGDRIVANSSTDESTEYVVVHGHAEPKRAEVAGRSFVLERRRGEHYYCSPSCASSDTRYVVPPAEVDATDPVAQEVAD